MLRCMRTTLTLDDDVAAMLRRVREERNVSLNEAVNQALRQGLPNLAQLPRREGPYRTPSASLGRCLVEQIDDIADVLAIAESPSYR